MSFIIFLLFPILEIVVLVELGERWGWINTILYFVMTAFVGLNFLKSAGMVRNPADSAVRFVAGILLMIPGMITDVMALLLLLPPTRKLVWWLLQKRLAKFAGGGNFQVYNFRSDIRAWTPHQPQEREARVIDVTPIPEKSSSADVVD